MAEFFMRVTKLTPSKGGCTGRAEYILDEAKQEKILLKSHEPVNWCEYERFEMTEVRRKDKTYKVMLDLKTGEKIRELVDVNSCVGREYIISFPNEMIRKIDKNETTIDELKKLVEEVIIPTVLKTDTTEKLGRLPEHCYAVHLNRKGSVKNKEDVERGAEPIYYECDNLHIHIIHSERHRQPPTGKWTRDIYFTDKGTQARNKNERAKDKSGNDLPPVHKKGEDKGCFSLKDKEYASKKWLFNTEQSVKKVFEDLGYSYNPRKYFAQVKVGRGKTHDKDGNLTRIGRIKKENEVLAKVNGIMEFYDEYTFPDNSRIDGKHNEDFIKFRSDVIGTLTSEEKLYDVIKRHIIKPSEKSLISKVTPTKPTAPTPSVQLVSNNITPVAKASVSNIADPERPEYLSSSEIGEQIVQDVLLGHKTEKIMKPKITKKKPPLKKSDEKHEETLPMQKVNLETEQPILPVVNNLQEDLNNKMMTPEQLAAQMIVEKPKPIRYINNVPLNYSTDKSKNPINPTNPYKGSGLGE